MKKLLVLTMLLLPIVLTGCGGNKFNVTPVQEVVTKIEGELHDDMINAMYEFESMGFGVKDESFVYPGIERNRVVMYDTTLDNPEKDSQLLLNYLDEGRGMELAALSLFFAVDGDEDLEQQVNTITDKMNDVISVISDTGVKVNKEKILNMIEHTVSTGEDLEEKDSAFFTIADTKYISQFRGIDENKHKRCSISLSFEPDYFVDILEDLSEKLNNQ